MFMQKQNFLTVAIWVAVWYKRRMKTIFLFDLDSTVTKQEILPTIAEEIGKKNEMRELTEKTMMGDLPFQESFSSRVKLLSQISVSRVADLVSEIKVNDAIVEFLNENKENSFIVTSNLDVWIGKLMSKIGMDGRYFCSTARVEDDKIVKIDKILAKDEVQDRLTSSAKIVAIGDGSNDYDMIRKADIGVSFGGVREIAPTLLDVSDYSVYDENKLCELLRLIRDEERTNE